MTKTDNEKYVKRGADMFIECNPEWEDEVSHANKGKAGAPYRYPGTLIMLAAALRVGIGVRYGQLGGTIGKMIGESGTPSFSQPRKRMGRLDVSASQGGMITVSDPNHSGMPAADATGPRQHDRGERMGKKWGARRGFVERHAVADTQTIRMVALSATDGSAADVAEFRPLPGRGMDAVGAKGGASGRSKYPGPDAPAGGRGGGGPPRHPACQNRPASGAPPPAPPPPDRPDGDKRRRPMSCTAMPRAAQGTAWPRARGRGSGHPARDQRDGARRGVGRRVGISVRDQWGAAPRPHGRTCWAARGGGRARPAGGPGQDTARDGWRRGILGIQAHVLGMRDVPQAGEHHTGDAAQGGPVQQVEGRVDGP